MRNRDFFMKELLLSQGLMATIIWVFTLSFVVSYLVLPKIIYIVVNKNLMDNPNERSSHTQRTPTMGGIAFFISIIFTIFFIRDYDVDHIGTNIISSVSILFFIGLKDDLVGVQPKTKIIGQVLSTLILFYGTQLWVRSLDGFFFINEIDFWISVLLSCMVMMAIVNSFNLIDGINGSAAMVGIVIFASFAYIFYLSGNHYYCLLSALCIGFLLAFLRYNLSEKKKIFMGDTGSMIVGFIIGFLVLKFFSLSPEELVKAHIKPINKIWVVLAVIFIPFFDTTRVFVTRIVRHGKPFLADRSHIHHVLIDYTGLTHGKASLFLAFINLVVLVVILYLNTIFSSTYVFLFLSAIFVGLALLLFYFNRSYNTRKSKQKIRRILNKTGLSKHKK